MTKNHGGGAKKSEKYEERNAETKEKSRWRKLGANASGGKSRRQTRRDISIGLGKGNGRGTFDDQ